MKTMCVGVIAAAVLGGVASGQYVGEGPVRAVVLTGHNNHNWQYTSRVHAETLVATGRFTVRVSDEPGKLLSGLKKDAQGRWPVDVFVLDYNDYHQAKRWGDEADRAFTSAVRDGVGVVAVHSANNAFKGWADYEQMLGLMWREGTGHGAFHEFGVDVVDGEHPVTKGMAGFRTPDELYHKLVNSQNAKYRLLASAMSSKESGGTGVAEPMAFTLEFGKGRVFATPLGHVWNGSDSQKRSVTNAGFRVLLSRGAEWAATGTVTLPAVWSAGAADASANTLSESEARSGWSLLFDGKSAERFRGYRKAGWPAEGWVVRDGCIVHEGGKGGGDIVTVDQYDDFELMIDWRVAPGGNSGVIYRVTEDKKYPWETGPEMQILDDAGHADGKKPKTRAGTLYDIVACSVDVSRPAGEWNRARLVVNGTKVEHWLNGFKVVDIDTAGEQYKAAHAASKWPGMKDYNTRRKGHIALQDHGDTVEFRNIKVRRVGAPNPPEPTKASRTLKAGGLTHGPFPGHCDPTTVTVWARGAAAGEYRLWLVDSQEKVVATAVAKATEENDLCMSFSVGALAAGSVYTARVAAAVNSGNDELPLPGAGSCVVRTPAEHTAKVGTTVVFGSCHNDFADRAQPIWEVIARQKPDALCLIGDTPYIDTTDLSVQRAKYGNLFAVPELAALRAGGTVMYGVWDDHDFGLNDTDGRLPGKENSRKAFLEYHANAGGSAGAGTGSAGVYSSFRRGPVEVFLIDARWFSNRDTKSLLGEAQWQWLLDGLKRSTAPFKLLATGMVWNDNVREKKTDYWGFYPSERQRLFDAMREMRIGGVVLVGGDIHRCRVFRHHQYSPMSPRERLAAAAPYTVHEWVSSPLGNSVHEAWNVPGPTLVWDVGEPRAFMSVRAEADRLTARWIDGNGREMFKQVLTLAELTPGEGGTVEYLPSGAAVAASRGSEWEQRHGQIVKRFEQPGAGTVVFIGDSITEGWGGAGRKQWEADFAPLGAVNAGISGDRTQSVLWRLENGLLTAMRAARTRLAVVMIGTNNSNGGDHSAGEIAEGVGAIVEKLTVELPETKVLLLAVPPRGEKANFQRRKVADINALIAQVQGTRSGRVVYLDTGLLFLDKDGWVGEVSSVLMPDFLHLSEKGYEAWAGAIAPKVREMIAE